MTKARQAASPRAPQTEKSRAFVVGAYMDDRARRRDKGPPAHRTPEARIDEAEGLARAIDLDIIGAEIVLVSKVRPASLIGKGKLEELVARIADEKIELVVMDCALSPVQQRNLEKAFAAKVIDRTGLILEIFGRRARTREGSLQVELAHLAYQRSRLVRSWTPSRTPARWFSASSAVLARPRSRPIGASSAERMARIELDLEKVKRTRGLHRKTRRRAFRSRSSPSSAIPMPANRLCSTR